MKKLSFEALESKADSVVSLELLSSISGGTENACHDSKTTTTTTTNEPNPGWKVKVIIDDGND